MVYVCSLKRFDGRDYEIKGAPASCIHALGPWPCHDGDSLLTVINVIGLYCCSVCMQEETDAKLTRRRGDYAVFTTSNKKWSEILSSRICASFGLSWLV